MTSITIPQPTIVPPARSYSTEVWEQKRELITQLYRQDSKTLQEVRAILAEQHDFWPTIAMLKKRITKWNLDKKRKHSDMLAALRIALDREAQGKNSIFLDRGRIVTFDDIKSYFTRRGVHDLHAMAAAQIASTSKPLITCHTPPATPTAPDRTGSKLADALDFEQLLAHGSSNESNSANAARSVSRSPKTGIQTQALRHLATPSNHLEKLLTCTGSYYDSVFEIPNWNKECSAFELDPLESFYHFMSSRYTLLEAGNGTLAFETFDHAFDLVRDILKKRMLLFLPYVYHMIAFYGGLHEQGVIPRLLEFIGQMIEIYYSHSHPIKQAVATLSRMSPEYRAFSAHRALQSSLEQMKTKIKPVNSGDASWGGICVNIPREEPGDLGDSCQTPSRTLRNLIKGVGILEAREGGALTTGTFRSFPLDQNSLNTGMDLVVVPAFLVYMAFPKFEADYGMRTPREYPFLSFCRQEYHDFRYVPDERGYQKLQPVPAVKMSHNLLPRRLRWFSNHNCGLISRPRSRIFQPDKRQH